ncbi:MAG: DUF3362 domain-containing protein, partial [Clostridia bacterium]|nr:DUF3362 domain-containing protein [Clostridia bacterium]
AFSDSATCMFYTGLDPETMERVYVPKTPEEKAEQRALLQYFRPENYDKVRAALRRAGRADLIGTGKDCLVPPDKRPPLFEARGKGGRPSTRRTPAQTPRRGAGRGTAGKKHRT